MKRSDHLPASALKRVKGGENFGVVNATHRILMSVHHDGSPVAELRPPFSLTSSATANGDCDASPVAQMRWLDPDIVYSFADAARVAKINDDAVNKGAVANSNV